MLCALYSSERDLVLGIPGSWGFPGFTILSAPDEEAHNLCSRFQFSPKDADSDVIADVAELIAKNASLGTRRDVKVWVIIGPRMSASCSLLGNWGTCYPGFLELIKDLCIEATMCGVTVGCHLTSRS